MSEVILHDYWVLWTLTDIQEDYPEGGLVRLIREGKSKWDFPDVVGFFYIDKPFFRKKLFNDLKEIYGVENLKFQDIDFTPYMSNSKGLACRIHLTKSSWDNLIPYIFITKYKYLKTQLDELAEYPPVPYLHVSFDYEKGYYRAKIKP